MSHQRPQPFATVLGLLALIVSFSPAWSERDDPYEEVNASWDRFGSVYSRVIESYYSPVDHERVMRAAIDGMLRQLDSYSQYFDEEGLRQLRQDTSGKFAGLGITVGMKDHHPVVISPIEGTPADRAGLLPGDLIVAIEGHDTFGLSLEDVVTQLRGEPGSTVRITLAREGAQANWDVEIVREIIKINSVAVADEVVPGIGYISMKQTRFSEETSSEVEAAIDQLNSNRVRGLILDLRGNPGGLLSQAAEVADLFLPRGAPIVTVRERDGRSVETKVSQRRPPALETPLVVLIDGGSASAAEIVAGAIQDNDRGLVVGTTSFGKGSVQTIFDLRDQDNAALKLTTALYYTPSGRSIHRESLAPSGGLLMPIPFGDVELPAGLLLSVLLRSRDLEAAAEQLRARFDLDEATARQVLTTPLGELVGVESAEGHTPASGDDPSDFHTNRGRIVHGGGGIEPDLVIEADVPPPFVQELYRHRAFFDFVVEYVGKAKQATTLTTEVGDSVLAAFRDYLPRSAVAEARRRQSRLELESLRQLADESGWDGAILTRIDSLEAAIESTSGQTSLPPAAIPYIRDALRRELSLRLAGGRASLLTDLEADPQVTAAIALLHDPERYADLLEGNGD